MRNSVLIIDDDEDLTFVITDMLEGYGYKVTSAASAEAAFTMLGESTFDLILLDINLPDSTGFKVCEELRQVSQVPVIFASARTSESDRITGFDIGGDDYLPKPFVMEELLARVRAILRRRESFMPAVLEAGDIRLDPSDATLRCGGKSVELQNREYQLMEALMKNPGIFQSADSLVISAWGYDAEADANSVRVYLSGLRKKPFLLGRGKG